MSQLAILSSNVVLRNCCSRKNTGIARNTCRNKGLLIMCADNRSKSTREIHRSTDQWIDDRADFIESRSRRAGREAGRRAKFLAKTAGVSCVVLLSCINARLMRT
eukprot:1189619-Prorocentrum_minimum.AAC.3